MGNLIGRLNKIEQSIPTHIGAKGYIKAMEMYLSGEDNGEALQALPSLNRSGTPFTFVELFINALSSLRMKARFEGKDTKLRKSLQVKSGLESSGSGPAERL